MERNNRSVPLMEDSEIQERVAALAGKNAKILDCEKKSSLVTEEVLLLNGQPIHLSGEAGERIKACMKAGQPPPPELLSEILIRSGIQTAPVQVETVTTVKSNTKTSEVSTLKDSHGQLVDEKMKEFEEDDEFESTNVELWEKEPEDLLRNLEKERSRMWELYNMRYSPPTTPDATQDNGRRRPKETPPPPPSTPTSKQPGKIPSRMTLPSDPKLRPPIPPKPNIRLASSGYVGRLRTDKNLSLPVRVVYETFI